MDEGIGMLNLDFIFNPLNDSQRSDFNVTVIVQNGTAGITIIEAGWQSIDGGLVNSWHDGEYCLSLLSTIKKKYFLQDILDSTSVCVNL